MRDSNFDALHKFRTLSPDEKLESLFLQQREQLDKADDMIARQDLTNGSVRETKARLAVHLNEHKEQQDGINYIKAWGARGTAAILLMLAIFGGFEALAHGIHYLR